MNGEKSTEQARATDLLARLVEDRPNTLAAVAEDCHGTYCVYCGRRGWADHEPPRPRPDHRDDCPIEQGQRFLERIYGDGGEEPGKTTEVTAVTQVREIEVRFSSG